MNNNEIMRNNGLEMKKLMTLEEMAELSLIEILDIFNNVITEFRRLVPKMLDEARADERKNTTKRIFKKLENIGMRKTECNDDCSREGACSGFLLDFHEEDYITFKKEMGVD